MSFAKLVLFLFGFLSAVVLSSPVAQEAQWQTATTSSVIANPTACGDIIEASNEGFYVFDADSAYQCLVTVPFNPAVATRFIKYYNETLQFQSTLAYLRNPPASYQQPSIDVIQALKQIQENVTLGLYNNQYEFEATLQSVVIGMHDAHVQLSAGALSAFTFGSYYDLMSISLDGKQLPQLYVKHDVIQSQTPTDWTLSPIVSINGEDAVKSLAQSATLNSVGMLEPHADWNQMMYSPLQDIEGTYNTYGWQMTFYPGEDWNITFANGTTQNLYFLSFYNNFDPTGPLLTGGDFYNYFVLGLLPDSYNLTVDDSYNSSVISNTTSITTTGWYNVSQAYPSNPDVVQPNLSVTGGGFITGYFLNDTSTGVLSIPSFDVYGDIVGTFSATIADFIQRAKAIGITRVVIDVQQNFGGTSLLAIDTFRQFFPDIKEFAGSRRRSFELANVLGGAMTDFWSSLTPESDLYDPYYQLLAANEWVVTDRLNAATGQNFSSWQEYYGPVPVYGDEFSLTERYNLSSIIFDNSAFQGWMPGNYTGDSRPWDPKNIVILTDGICSSTCSLFVELMTQQGGVRTVVVGGAPRTGPMQAASGSRGARSFDSFALDANFNFVPLVNETAGAMVPLDRDPNVYTYYAGFNLRDQIRPNDSEPVQFKYEAANCRIFYTLANAYNMSRLWRDAASATWDDPSLCVAGSTGYATTGNTTVANSPPAASVAAFQVNPAVSISSQPNHFEGLPDDRAPRKAGTIQPCTRNCIGGCKRISCGGGVTTLACLPTCTNVGGYCSGDGVCLPNAPVESKQRTVNGNTLPSRQITQGTCYPDVGTPALGCPA